MRTKQSKWKQAISYRRVSTEEQGRHGIGLDGQKAAIDTYAQLDRLRISGSFHDVGTGRGENNLLDRPGLMMALEVAKATGRPIIASGLDRISRHAQTLDQIVKEYQVTIISANDGEIRNAVLLASKAAQAERQGDLISERTKHALAVKKAQGISLGNRRNLAEAQRLGVLRKQEVAEQKVREIASILKALSDEKSARELVAILNERGIRTSRNLPWTVSGLRRPLRSAKKLVRRESQQAESPAYDQNPVFGSF
ncbi:recombinase family protein [Mesorhizobium sp. L2C084A000]|uniref:recombinase family protein n=1 Tax=Mesorhizobium sp. L2C084A000 TaxID=1287116 RepID=UPI0003D0356A|nr:recombinase family protein [Mesorhizobium sp. L2C084A000]ESZ30591.1 hypothetical protein X734_03935 [Mesorhizobium sp. L2C084A000]